MKSFSIIISLQALVNSPFPALLKALEDQIKSFQSLLYSRHVCTSNKHLKLSKLFQKLIFCGHFRLWEVLGCKQMRSITPERVQNHLLSLAHFASPNRSQDIKLPLAQSPPQNVLCPKPKLILVPRSKNNICLPKRSPCSSWLRILIKASFGEDQWVQGAHKVILQLMIVYKAITVVLYRAQGQSWPQHNTCSPPLLLNCIKQSLAMNSACPV